METDITIELLIERFLTFADNNCVYLLTIMEKILDYVMYDAKIKKINSPGLTLYSKHDDKRVLRSGHSHRVLCSVSRSRSTASAEAVDVDQTRSFDEIPSAGGIYDVPYIGTALMMKPFTEFTTTNLHQLFKSLYEQYGDIVKFRAGKDWMVLLYKPEYIQRICMEPIKNPFRPPLLLLTKYYERRNTIGSLGTINGEEWANFRKPAQDQILKPTMVANYVPLIDNVANDFVENLKTKSTIDCLDEFYKYTTESVGMLCFNRRLGCLDEGSEHNTSELNVMSSIKTFFSVLNSTTFQPIPLYWYFRTPKYNRFEEAADRIYKLADAMLAQRKVDDAIEAKSKVGDLEVSSEEPNLLTTLLNDPRLTAEQSRRLIQDLFSGGVDSTANSMAFLLYNLAKFPEKQELLYQEISSKSSKDQSVTKEVFGKMPYLKACVKESFRLYHPISTGSVRVFNHDIMIGGYNIPKNTTILAVGSVISRNEKYYKHAKDYVPERWLREVNEYNQEKINPFGQLPFGFGARSCIGQRFAENEIYVATIKMIQNFKFKLPPEMKELEYEYQIFATPKHSVKLLIEQRP